MEGRFLNYILCAFSNYLIFAQTVADILNSLFYLANVAMVLYL